MWPLVRGLEGQRTMPSDAILARALAETERASHDVRVHLPERFDVVVHLDETRALEPLERTAAWDRGELPETFPTGL